MDIVGIVPGFEAQFLAAKKRHNKPPAENQTKRKPLAAILQSQCDLLRRALDKLRIARTEEREVAALETIASTLHILKHYGLLGNLPADLKARLDLYCR